MKKTTLLYISILFYGFSFSQGGSVSTAEQFCSGGSELVFPNTTGSPSSSSIGCLFSTPNAAYYYLTINQPGDLIFTISQEDNFGNPIDVDFIAWGPFNSLAEADASITLAYCATCPNNTTNPNFYPYAPDMITDCSFDIAPTETLTINGAITGEIYIVLITNYDGAEGSISIQQTNGLGTTSCGDLPICGNVFIDSGGDTGSYSNNESETTTIYPATAGGTTTVSFTEFDLASGDILTVYNGPDPTYPSLGSFSGSTLPGNFTSTDATGTLTFVFTSNSSNVGTGWSANISCSTPPPPPSCGGEFYDTGGTSGTYLNNESHTTTIYPTATGGTVTVDFTMLDLQPGDTLSVYDGTDNTAPSLGNVTTTPSSFSSTNSLGALTFVFTSNSNGLGNGWEANVTCITPPTCSSHFFDSGGDSNNYTSNEQTTTTFTPDVAGTALTATFTSFNLENGYDYLYIYNGPDDSYPLLGTFSGTNSPGVVTSSDPSGALTFVFESDGSITYEGWEANFSCAPYTPPVVCGSTFYDSGGASGNYTNNENQTTTFYPDSANSPITVTFTSFNLESGYDFLNVYDGPDATYPLLGMFTGSNIPGPFTSTDASGALTFTFDSDSLITYDGWSANISCIDPCNLTIAATKFPTGANACNLDYTALTTNATNTYVPNIIFSESFDTAGIPTGWSINNGSNTGGSWSINNSSDAGGTPYEASLSGGSIIYATGGRILNSPNINISGLTNLQLNFKQYLYHFSSYYIYNIAVETKVDTDPWTSQYSVTPVTNDINSETRNIDLSSLSGTTLRIRFRLYGRPFGVINWNIDDIEITTNGNIIPPQITWSPTTGLYTDSSLSTAYTGGFSETVYAAPNSTETYTATDQNGCTDSISITNSKKVWNGSQSTDWYDAANWSPTGIPTNQNCVIIPNVTTTYNRSPIVLGITPPIPPSPGLGKSLLVQSDGYLELLQYANLIITDDIEVEPDGQVILRSGSNLIQITDTGTTNSGDIQVQRTVSNVASHDYIYWSSPVDGFGVTNVSPGSNLIYSWLPTTSAIYGNWQATTEIMQTGKGYIIRGISGTAPESTSVTNTVEFKGKPKNGLLQTPITRGNYTGPDYAGAGNTNATELDDNWNLIGNPYPSSISADAFILENASALSESTDSNTPSISGTVYLWRHETAPSSTTDPFYADYVYNYNANDYIGYNSTGSNPPGFNGNIASGQAFFVLMEHSATSPSNVVFKNEMRYDSGILPYDNNEFFRSNQVTNRQSLERHRIWLDLIATNNTANSILIGYIENATNNLDRLYDGYELSETNNRFYSTTHSTELAIQGRALPFHNSDLVPLGIEIANSGEYKIALNSIDGLFETTNQTIFIEDTYTNQIHNIRISPYSFTTETGKYDDRFILRYTDNALSIENFNTIQDLSITAPNSDYIKVSSKNNSIVSVVIYDILGRKLLSKNNLNTPELKISNNSFSDGTYVIKATTNNNQVYTERIILKR
ncbi:CUB domain-containing protein [Bizionia sp. KMM 8389]